MRKGSLFRRVPRAQALQNTSFVSPPTPSSRRERKQKCLLGLSSLFYIASHEPRPPRIQNRAHVPFRPTSYDALAAPLSRLSYLIHGFHFLCPWKCRPTLVCMAHPPSSYLERWGAPVVLSLGLLYFCPLSSKHFCNDIRLEAEPPCFHQSASSLIQGFHFLLIYALKRHLKFEQDPAREY